MQLLILFVLSTSIYFNSEKHKNDVWLQKLQSGNELRKPEITLDTRNRPTAKSYVCHSKSSLHVCRKILTSGTAKTETNSYLYQKKYDSVPIAPICICCSIQYTYIHD